MKFYVLENRRVVSATRSRWAAFVGSPEAQVCRTEVNGHVVSTVLIGFDHAFRGQGLPVLWETMVFDAAGTSVSRERCNGSVEQAETMHTRVAEGLRR